MNPRKLEFSGFLFDGRSARKYSAAVRLTPRELTISLPGGPARSWPYPGLRLSGTGTTPDHPPWRVEHEVDEPGGPRIETLVVQDPGFSENVRRTAVLPLHPTWSRRGRGRPFLLATSVLAVPLFLFGLWRMGIPALADHVADRVPVAWEEKLGDRILPEFQKGTTRPKPNPKRQKPLRTLVRRLMSTVPNARYHPRVHIHPGKIVNALALPGGHIIVFQGLLNLADSPEELAGVLAHEIQHVLLRHSTRGIIRSMASSMLLTLMLGDVNGVMQAVLHFAGNLEGLRHSREMERKADREGMKMILAAKIDPAGMVRIFEKLRAEEEKLSGGVKENSPETSPASWPEYLSTHPSGSDRARELKKWVAKNPQPSYTPLLPHLDWEETFHQEAE